MKLKPAKPRPDLALVYRSITSIKESENNTRIHTPAQIGKIADSMRAYANIVPILIDEDNVILAGHGRLAAAKKLGMTMVPTICVTGLSPAERRAFTIADNKLTDLSAFDKKKLATEFKFLIGSDIKFDLELTGFDISEVDKLLNMEFPGSDGGPLQVPALDAVAVSRPGDLWIAGPHRFLCSSSLDRKACERLFGEERAALTVTDPPYNVKIAGNVSGLGKKVHGEFAMASGEMSRSEFTYQFLRPAFQLIADFSLPGAIAFVFMDWRHTRDVENAAEGVFKEHKNTICWVKSNAGMGSFYRSQHEMVLAFLVLTGKIRNNFGLGGKGRHRSNVWQYSGVNTFRKGRMDDLASHPTIKNQKMIADAILDCSAPGDVVFDGFLGSGTTALGAAATGRRCYGIELDPIYVDLIISRLENIGLTARLESGETFTEVAAARGVSLEEDK